MPCRLYALGMAYGTQLRQLIPGTALAAAVGAGGLLCGRLEATLLGREWIEGLVLAIIIGMALRLFWKPADTYKPGLAFSAKPLLEIAILLLGASINFGVLRAIGPQLFLAVGLLVVTAIGGGFVIGRAFGLPPRLAVLVACGNAICGNSAIATLAPVIGADEEQTAAAVTFTALGSVIVVLLLPALHIALALTHSEFGALAGLSVYAVPQVLAATAGAGLVALQTGTIVKLARVLMLAPVTFFFATLARREAGPGSAQAARLDWQQMLPPFIIGFIGLAILRSTGVLPETWALVLREVAGLLTIVAMAALGLSSDPRAVCRSGRQVGLAAGVCLVALLVLGWGLICLLKL